MRRVIVTLTQCGGASAVVGGLGVRAAGALSDRGGRNKRGQTSRRSRDAHQGMIDLDLDDRAADVELHFQRAMEHMKSIPVDPMINEDLRVKRIQDDTRPHNVDGHIRSIAQGEPSPDKVRSFFDEDGFDIRSNENDRTAHQEGSSLWHRRGAGARGDDILGLSGNAGPRYQAHVDATASLESLAPSDPTVVEESDTAYGDTPVQMTDMLKERLIELKAEKLSSNRNETVLRRRLSHRAAHTSLPSRGVDVAKAQDAADRAKTLGDAVASVETDSTDEQQRRRAQASAYLQESEDLVPGLSSYDPFAPPASRGTHDTTLQSPQSSVLLLRTLQRACLTSRREAIELIAAGEVTVDGAVERNPFRRVEAANDIKLRGHPQRIRFAPSRLWVYHKPANVMVSRHDPGGRTLFTKHAQLLGIDHLIPIGSLPFKAHGIILLTNDGELSSYLEHPKANIQQTYHFRIKPAIDPILANKLNTEGMQINGITYRGAEFLVNHAARSRFHVKLKVRGETMPAHHLMAHLGRTIQRGGRVSFGPFTLHGLAAGGLREVAVPPYYAQHIGGAWKPFVERDWPHYRRQRVQKLQKLSRFRELRPKELEELDAFTFDEFKDALSYESAELSEAAAKVARAMHAQPHVDDADLRPFDQSLSPSAGYGGVPLRHSGDADAGFVDDITQVR